VFPEVHYVKTSRLTQAVRISESFDAQKPPLLLIHGNASDSTIWKYVCPKLSTSFSLIIPDLRGYGFSEDLPINAKEGVKVWVDDLIELLDALHIPKTYVCGHSLGGVVCMGMLASHADRILGMTLLAPGTQYGYGGTKDVLGTPCFEDFAGTGAGLINRGFIERVKQRDFSEDEPATAPKVIIKRLFFSDSFECPEDVLSELLESLFRMKIGEQRYPGDFVESVNWPGFAPGVYGAANAISPKYNQWIFPDIMQLPTEKRPPLHWIHGTDDKLVSNQALSDAGTAGKLGLIKNWPGVDTYPPQPMFEQLRYFLEKYDAESGKTRFYSMSKTGHCPQVENPSKTTDLIISLLDFC